MSFAPKPQQPFEYWEDSATRTEIYLLVKWLLALLNELTQKQITKDCCVLANFSTVLDMREQYPCRPLKPPMKGLSKKQASLQPEASSFVIRCLQFTVHLLPNNFHGMCLSSAFCAKSLWDIFMLIFSQLCILDQKLKPSFAQWFW